MKLKLFERVGRSIATAQPDSRYWFSVTEGVARHEGRVRRVGIWRSFETLDDVLRGISGHAEVLGAVGGGAVSALVETLEADGNITGFVHTDDRLVGWEDATRHELEVRGAIDPALAVTFHHALVTVLEDVASTPRSDITYKPTEDWGLTARGELTLAFHAYPDWRHYSHGAAAGLLEHDYSYLAPESIDGRKPTAKTFVYSVGYGLHRMLAGRPPFIGDTGLATLIAIRSDATPDLAERRAGLDPELTRITNACLAKDEDDRPSLTEVRKILAALGPEPFLLDHWVERHYFTQREARRRLEGALARMDFEASYRTLEYTTKGSG